MARLIRSGFFGRNRNRGNDTSNGTNLIGITVGGDIAVNTQSIPNNVNKNINLRRTTSDGIATTQTVGNFDEIGYISLLGEYPQNRVDLPRFDLSNVVSLNTDIANFNFILSLKDGDGDPKLFASKNVMIDLIAKYGNNNPIPVNYLINERKLIVIDIKPFKLLTEEMRLTELSINLNRSEIDGRVEVTKNLFTYSNYTIGDGSTLVATPSYDLNELIKYITWVVSKPSGTYDERLIPANELGEWNGSTADEPAEDDPSTETTNEPERNQYTPIGRAGIKDGEEVFKLFKRWVWNAELDMWQKSTTRYPNDDSDSQTGGGGRES